MNKIIVPLLFLGLLMSACRKQPLNHLNLEETNVYITEYDSTLNFQQYESFRIADSVSLISNGQFSGREAGVFDTALVGALRRQLTLVGFREASVPGSTPDIGINITKIISDYTGLISYNDYWGIYDSYWDPFYWGYGGYNYYFPYSFGVYSFQEGAISIDMVDLKNPDTVNNRLNSVWTGLARGSGIFQSTNINSMVQALFAQSPYLTR